MRFRIEIKLCLWISESFYNSNDIDITFRYLCDSISTVMFWLFNQSILDLSVKFTELEVRIYNIKLHDDETSLYTISKILLIIQYQLNFDDSPKRIDILNFHSLLYYTHYSAISNFVKYFSRQNLFHLEPKLRKMISTHSIKHTIHFRST